MDLPEGPKYFFWQLVKDTTIFRILLNEITKLVDFHECLKYFSDCPQLVKDSTSFRMILYLVSKLVDLPEGPEYFFWFPITYKILQTLEYFRIL